MDEAFIANLTPKKLPAIAPRPKGIPAERYIYPI